MSSGAAGLGLFAAACGSGSGSSKAQAEGSAKSSTWTFTDDRGTRLTAAQPPRRVVAYTGTAAALHDFGFDCVGVFGPTTLAGGKADPMAGDLDVTKLTVIGNTYGEFDIEKYATVRPELLVTEMYESGSLWYVPDDSKDKIAKLAPSAAFTVAKIPYDQPIARHAQLAASLGADLSSAANVAAKDRFTKAAQAVRDAAKAKPGLKVMAASAAKDLLYVSDPKVSTDLLYFKQLGVDMVQPTKVEGSFFESLSWENADKYSAGLILLDNRTGTLQPTDLSGHPTWSRLPAVRANQITGWSSEPRFSYAGAAPILEQLAQAITSARVL